jgi:hypothetical protein
MNENIISFTATNMITITLMAAIGLAASGLALTLIKQAGGMGDATA